MENSYKLYYRFNLSNLIYTLAVIVWGAFVRASGSGAGCGAHWPLCNGEILPASSRLQTLIEFTHRSTSGVSLVLVLVGWVISRKVAVKNSPIRRAASFAVVAILLEAALGAGLVLLRLVEFDQSMARAVSISLHLLNTLFLVATLVTLTVISREPDAYCAGTRRILPKDGFFRGALLVFGMLGISGAVAALGDTLFKAPSLSAGLVQDLSANAHFLIKLRIFHPVLACTWVFLGFMWSQQLLESEKTRSVRGWFVSALILQFCLGFLNWMLLAPTALQLIHLLVADCVFMSFWISGLQWSTVEDGVMARLKESESTVKAKGENETRESSL